MKSQKSQSGFGIVEIILIVLVVSLSAAIAWLVIDRQKTEKVDTTPSTSQGKNTPPKTSKSDGDPAKKCGISYILPAALKDYSATSFNDIAGCSLQLKSPDFQEAAAEIGTTEVVKGGRITLRVDESSASGAVGILETHFIKGTLMQQQYDNHQMNSHEFNINGNDAVQFEVSYEGDSPYAVIMDLPGTRYIYATADGVGYNDAALPVSESLIELLKTVK